MENRKKKLASIIILSLFFAVNIFLTLHVFGLEEPPANCTGDFENVGGVCIPTNTGLSDTPVQEIISSVLTWILGIFGFLGIISFVISGILYLTAAGSVDQEKRAKKAMVMSIIGVIIGISGLVIIYAVSKMLNATPDF